MPQEKSFGVFVIRMCALFSYLFGNRISSRGVFIYSKIFIYLSVSAVNDVVVDIKDCLLYFSAGNT